MAVDAVKAAEVIVASHPANETKKTAGEDPVVHDEPSTNDIKAASEPKVESNGADSSVATKEGTGVEQNGPTEVQIEKVKEGEKEEKESGTKDGEENGDKKEPEKQISDEAKAGEKRKADEQVVHENADEKVSAESDAKKQKTSNGTANDTKKGRGRPKSVSNGENPPAAKKQKKVPVVGKSERKTRSQGAA